MRPGHVRHHSEHARLITVVQLLAKLEGSPEAEQPRLLRLVCQRGVESEGLPTGSPSGPGTPFEPSGWLVLFLLPLSRSWLRYLVDRAREPRSHRPPNRPATLAAGAHTKRTNQVQGSFEDTQLKQRGLELVAVA